METLHPAALLQRGDRGEQRAMRVPLGQLDRAGSAANVLSSPGADALRASKVRLREEERGESEGKRDRKEANREEPRHVGKQTAAAETKDRRTRSLFFIPLTSTLSLSLSQNEKSTALDEDFRASPDARLPFAEDQVFLLQDEGWCVTGGGRRRKRDRGGCSFEAAAGGDAAEEKGGSCCGSSCGGGS